MKRKKLFISLIAAGGLTAGLGTSLGPASAQQRVITATLITGQVVTITTPAGTPCTADSLGPLAAPVATVTCTDTPAPPPQTGQPTPTTPTTPGQPSQPNGPSGPTPPAGPTTKPQPKPKPTTRLGAKRVENSAGQPQPPSANARTNGGAPTLDNPGFTLATPGAAPIGVPNFFIDKFRIPPFLLPIYQAAGIEYEVPWQVLAAINEIETDYGRNLNVSTAGAMGWMQFIPSSWRSYGVDANNDGRKDPYNPVDAIFAAARYLKAAGAKQNIRQAIFAYNHATWYVDSVMLRAKLIGGLPEPLVGALTGLTQGHFPVAARATYADDVTERAALARTRGANVAKTIDSSPTRRGINIYAKPGSSVIAVNDGVIKSIGQSAKLGRYVVLRDVYGNTYTYAQLGGVAASYPAPKPKTVSAASIKRELELPRKPSDPKPTQAATAGAQPTKGGSAASSAPSTVRTVQVSKERLFANPSRHAAYRNGGEQQLLQTGKPVAGYTTFEAYFKQVLGLPRQDVVLQPLRPGAQVIAGTVLGRIDKVAGSPLAPHLHFSLRPAGKGSPAIDPKPILDGWKLLESTAIYRAAGKNPFFGPDAKNPTIGQILLMSKDQMQRRALADPRIQIYDCGRRDVLTGQIDRRVLAALLYLTSSGLKPTVSSLKCGHSYFTKAGGVSMHSSGNAVDIAAVNGIPIVGHQGPGTITDITIRRLLTLQGNLRATQIISLMKFAGQDNTLVLPDHFDHIHVGWAPNYGDNAARYDAALKPGQWIKLIDRLNHIDNPTVAVKPSKAAIPVGKRGE